MGAYPLVGGETGQREMPQGMRLRPGGDGLGVEGDQRGAVGWFSPQTTISLA